MIWNYMSCNKLCTCKIHLILDTLLSKLWEVILKNMPRSCKFVRFSRFKKFNYPYKPGLTLHTPMVHPAVSRYMSYYTTYADHWRYVSYCLISEMVIVVKIGAITIAQLMSGPGKQMYTSPAISWMWIHEFT